MLQALLKTSEASALLAISERKIWELTNRGELACVRVGRTVRYRPEDLEVFIQARLSVSRNCLAGKGHDR